MASLFQPPPSPFEPPSVSYRLRVSPVKFLAQSIYALVTLLRGRPDISKISLSSRVRLVCISDTHTQKPLNLPPGDVLIHAGDLTNAGTANEIQDQVDWLASLPYEYKIVIAGNHDSFFDPRSRLNGDEGKEIHFESVSYLQHSSVTLCFAKHKDRKLSFYGAPQIPSCGGQNFAFQYVSVLRIFDYSGNSNRSMSRTFCVHLYLSA